MNRLQIEVYNEGERLIPYVTHNEDELVRHRSSYAFFYNVVKSDLESGIVEDPSEISVVDLGFGCGYGCALLSSLPNSKITGVEIGEECEEYANQYYLRNNVEYQIHDLSKYMPTMPEFDYVVSRGVLEHVDDGLELIGQGNAKYRAMIDVPYDEAPGNEHHVLTEIKEDTFADIENCELFYETLDGTIYSADQKPEHSNMIMAVVSAPGLPKVTDMFSFPIEPVKSNELEKLSEKNSIGVHKNYETIADLLLNAEKYIRNTEVVLDIGCGIRPIAYFRPKLHLMIEPWTEYAEILSYRYQGDKSVIVIKQNAITALASLANNSVDSIFLIDVIEHMSKEDGEKVLKEVSRVAREQVVVFTPMGFMPQHVDVADSKDNWGLTGGSTQEHLSGWTPKDFGEKWTFLICDKAHKDEKGEIYGAFFAILNLHHEELAKPESFSDIRNQLPSERMNIKLSYENQSLISENEGLRARLLGIESSIVFRILRKIKRILS